MIRAAIVDLDGTMIDTTGDFLYALNHMLDDLRLPHIDAAFVHRTVGKGSPHLIRSTLEHCGAVPERFHEAYARYEHHYLSVNGEHSEVYPGVVEGLQALRAQGLRLACATNKPTAFAGPLLENKKLRPYFDVVFGGDAFERKPHPEPLLKTCEALGTLPAHTLMIGDSSNDAQAARAAGCPVVLMSYGYNHGQPVHEVDADAHVDRLDQIDLDALAARPTAAGR